MLCYLLLSLLTNIVHPYQSEGAACDYHPSPIRVHCAEMESALWGHMWLLQNVKLINAMMQKCFMREKNVSAIKEFDKFVMI